MLASELIKKLQELIDTDGDQMVFKSGSVSEFNYEDPVEEVRYEYPHDDEAGIHL